MRLAKALPAKLFLTLAYFYALSAYRANAKHPTLSNILTSPPA